MTGPRVLVAYGTKNGGTAGIAETIAQTLREHGLDAEVRSARDVRDTTGYAGVVLGGALYMSRWHADAARFTRRHRKALAGRPVWLFSSGPLDTSAEDHDIPPVRSARRAMESLRARQHWTFGGVLSEDATGWTARHMAAAGKAGDFRNRDQIRQWAQQIAAALLQAGDITHDQRFG